MKFMLLMLVIQMQNKHVNCYSFLRQLRLK